MVFGCAVFVCTIGRAVEDFDVIVSIVVIRMLIELELHATLCLKTISLTLSIDDLVYLLIFYLYFILYFLFIQSIN